MWLKNDYEIMIANAEKQSADCERWSKDNFQKADECWGLQRLEHLEWGHTYAEKAEFHRGEADWWRREGGLNDFLSTERQTKEKEQV